MLLKLYLNNNAYPLDDLSNWFVTHHYGGSKSMQFDVSTHHPHYKKILEEVVLEYNNRLYLVKQINERTASATAAINCELELDGLKSKIYPEFKVESETFDHITNEILSGTGWRIINPELVANRRTIELTDVTPLDILEHCTNSTMFNIVYDFDNINRTIKIIKPTIEPTSDVYFTDELNLTNLCYKASSTSFVTRLYAYGKDGLTIASVNDGKEYVDNTDYCDKTICAVWRDDRYTKAQSLKDAAIEKLKVLSRPERSYTCKIIDLAKLNSDYKFLSVSLYKMVTLIDREHATKTLNQIVEYKEYPNAPENNEATLSTVSAKIVSKLITMNDLINDINTENIIDRQKINIIARDVESNSAKIAEIYTEGDTECIIYSLINQTATEIRTEVSKKIGQDELTSQISQTAEQLRSEISQKAGKDELTSAINQTAAEIRTEVSKKVGKDEFSTQIIQNAEYIQMAWNKVSEIIQFENAQFCIYDSANSNKKLLLKLMSTGLCVYDEDSNKLMELNRNGENFYYKGSYLGKIGTNHWSGYDDVRGLVIDLDYNDDYVAYVALAAKQSSSANSYTIFLSYFNKDTYVGSETKKGLHLGDTFYTDGHNIYLSAKCYTTAYDRNAAICIKDSGDFEFTSERSGSDDIIFKLNDNEINSYRPFVLNNSLNQNGNFIYISDNCYTRRYQSQNQGAICIKSGDFVFTAEGTEYDDLIILLNGSAVHFYKNTDFHNWSIQNANIENDSDKRLKTNIKDTEINGLDVISRLKLRQFDWKKDNSHCDIGFIAQEAGEVRPNFMGTKDDGYHTIKLIEMIPYLVKAVQELSWKVEEQQKIIEKFMKGCD